MDIAKSRNIHTVVYVSIKGRSVILAGPLDKILLIHTVSKFLMLPAFRSITPASRKYFQKKMEQVLLFAGRSL